MEDKIYSKEEAAHFLKMSIASLDRLMKAEKISFSKVADGISGKVLFRQSALNDFLKSTERPLGIDAQIAKLKSESPPDDKSFPEEGYSVALALLQERVAKARGLLAGGPGWFEQKISYQKALKWLSRMELLFSLFRCMPVDEVGRLIDSCWQQFAALVQLKEQNDGINSLPKSVYPRASNGSRFRSGLEMAHEFFNLSANQQLEIKNVDTQDHSTWAGALPGGGVQYRLPAGGAWTPIPAFIGDARPGTSTPGLFHVAADVFGERHVLEIRVVKKSESRPPVSVVEEREAAEAAKKAKVFEHAELIDTIAKGDE